MCRWSNVLSVNSQMQEENTTHYTFLWREACNMFRCFRSPSTNSYLRVWRRPGWLMWHECFTKNNDRKQEKGRGEGGRDRVRTIYKFMSWDLSTRLNFRLAAPCFHNEVQVFSAQSSRVKDIWEKTQVLAMMALLVLLLLTQAFTGNGEQIFIYIRTTGFF